MTDDMNTSSDEFSTSSPTITLPIYARRQNRISIILRPIMSLWFLIFLSLYGIVVILVSIPTWLVALVTGRIPESLRDLNLGFVQYQAEVMSYKFFLTRRYPAIHAGRPSRQLVDVGIDDEPLGRAAVATHLLLILPSVVVSVLLYAGQVLISLVMWIIGMVTSRQPQVLHNAAAVVVRFCVRSSAYWLFLTPVQPFAGVWRDDLVGEEISPSETITDDTEYVHNEVPVGSSTRRIVIATLVLGLAGSFVGTYVGIQISREPSAGILAKATDHVFFKILNEMSAYEHSAQTCTNRSCRATAAFDDSILIATDIRNFVRTHPPIANVILKYNKFEETAQVLVNDLYMTGVQPTSALQLRHERLYLVKDIVNLGAAHRNLVTALEN